MNKKICFFMYTPFTLGGEQRVVTVLANNLIEQGYNVDFILLDKTKKIDYSRYNMNKNIKIRFIHNSIKFKVKRKLALIIRKKLINTRILNKSLFLQKRMYSYCEKVADIINKEKYDYVIGVASEYYGILSYLKPKIKNTKVVAWQHSTFDAYYKTPGRRLYNQEKFIKEMFKNIDYYVCQTHDDKELISKHFNFDAIVINNPNTFKTSKKSNLSSKIFMAAGRFSKIKGFDMLIESFNLFSKNDNEWKLYIIGDGEEKKKYIEKIKKYNLQDRIVLKPKTNNIEEYYLNSSVYLMSSLWEGWGMVVTEAMQYGLPVISYDLPSTKEIFGNLECGILVEKFNIEKYAYEMGKIVKNKKQLKKFSDNAIKQVKKFDIEKIGKKWTKEVFN